VSGHHHADAPDDAFDRVLRRNLNVVAAVLAVATIVGLVVLWPSGSVHVRRELGVADAEYDATVTKVERIPCPGSDDTRDDEEGAATGADDADAGASLCESVTFRLDEGPDAYSTRTVRLFDVGAYPAIGVGDSIVVPYQKDADPAFRYTSSFERNRRWPLAVLALLFALLVVAQGRLRGLAALVGLIAGLGVIVVFVLPALVEGLPPVPVAIVAASTVAFLALYLAHGVNPLTTVALVGTLASLALVGLLSWTFTSLALLSGIDEDVQNIRVFGGHLNFQGLLLAGMLLGALGALDDMTVTQASAVAELKAANPAAGFRDLYRAGSRIGRDHIASTVNTLALAYAGASLPLLLLFVQSGRAFGSVVNSEVVATEIVRTLVGSIGLVASVPLTTVLASRLVSAGHRDRSEPGTALAAATAPVGEDPQPPPPNAGRSDDAGLPDDWDGYLRRHSPLTSEREAPDDVEDPGPADDAV
jgi:uncharacterized membrane protein